jgi:hypothetical protein
MASSFGFANSNLMGESFMSKRKAGGFAEPSRDELSPSSDRFSWPHAPRDMAGVTFPW